MTQAMTQTMPQTMTQGADGRQGLFPKADPNRYRRPKFWFCLFLLVLYLGSIPAANWIVFATSFVTKSGIATDIQILVLLFDLILAIMILIPFLFPFRNLRQKRDSRKNVLYKRSARIFGDGIFYLIRVFFLAQNIGWLGLFGFLLFYFMFSVFEHNYHILYQFKFIFILSMTYGGAYNIEERLFCLIKNVFNHSVFHQVSITLKNYKNNTFIYDKKVRNFYREIKNIPCFSKKVDFLNMRYRYKIGWLLNKSYFNVNIYNINLLTDVRIFLDFVFIMILCSIVATFIEISAPGIIESYPKELIVYESISYQLLYNMSLVVFFWALASLFNFLFIKLAKVLFWIIISLLALFFLALFLF